MIPKHVLAWLEESRRLGIAVKTADDRDLCLSRAAFESYALLEPDGIKLLKTLESGLWREADAVGLIKARQTAEGVRFLVPDWRKLVEFLRMVG